MSDSKTFECVICYEDEPMRMLVKCTCENEVCRKCAQRFLLSVKDEPKCPIKSCSAGWTKKFLYDNFPKVWVEGNGKGQLRCHLKSRLLELEEAKIPETIATDIPRLRDEEKKKQEVVELVKLVLELKLQIRDMEDHIHRLRGRKTTTTIPKFVFVCQCPKDKCKGLIERENYACAVCEGKICRRCRVAKETKEEKKKNKSEKHVCKQEDLDTIKFLRGDTKPCPKCAVPIYRISGCPQMWCTQCHVAFSWNTGQIETGVIHNPHAVRWRREHGENPREADDVPCGGLVQMHVIIGVPTHMRMYLQSIHRTIAEIVYKIRRNAITGDKERDLRLDYVLDRITKKELEQKLFLNYRINARKREMMMIFQTLRTLAVERFRNLMETMNSKSIFHVEGWPGVAIADDIGNRFSHYQLAEIAKTYGISDTQCVHSSIINHLRPQFEKNEKECTEILEEFFKDMERVRVFFNTTVLEEMPLLGSQSLVQLEASTAKGKGWYWTQSYRDADIRRLRMGKSYPTHTLNFEKPKSSPVAASSMRQVYRLPSPLFPPTISRVEYIPGQPPQRQYDDLDLSPDDDY